MKQFIFRTFVGLYFMSVGHFLWAYPIWFFVMSFFGWFLIDAYGEWVKKNT